ncbi:MAG TPA: ankyrin repeat domain-containing protein [Vicinamibacterales bacterium]|nr:ankyrin repeat domain-containing protein [Vicinamibacterales bacterium]
MNRLILIIGIMLVAASGPVRSQMPAGQLATVIQEGRRAAALAMVKAGADVNAAQPDGTRPIHWAVYRIDHELVDALIARKARVDVANEFGHTPLAEAVRQGDARMVKILLGAGSGTEGANADGQTALMAAIKNGDLPIVQMLLNAGARVNVVEKVQDQTPLMWAAAATRNAAEMVKLLIAKGADVNARARFNDWPSQITSEPRGQYHASGGLTPLLYAARGGCYACVDSLVAGGADVNLPTPEGVSPIMIAIENGHNGIARLLMERGGNPHVWDVYGRTALYLAVGEGGGPGGRGAAVAPAAGGRGAAPAAGGRGAGPGAGAGRGAPAGRGAVASANNGPQVSATEMVNLLLGEGVDPNPQLNMRRPSAQGGRFNDPLLSTGTTPLLRALINNDTELVRLLLEKGANPNIFGMGLSPWLYAAGIRSGTYNSNPARGGGSGGVGTGSANVDMALLDLMLTRGADVNARVTGAASYSGRIARALTGDPVNTTSNEGMTALHVAVRSRNPSLVRYLLDKGARTDIKDASGRTPLDVLNGVPAYQPAVFADADGVVPPNPNAAPPAPAAAAGNVAAVEEIRGLLQAVR